jgi:large subunit ribosomal protein L9
MKIILQRDIPKVGKNGEIVNVADGYARNYLFPRQYAVAAVGGALRALETRLALEKTRDGRQLDAAKAGASKLEGKSLTIIAKAGTGTKLYGSITAQDITDRVKSDLGVTVDKRRVGLADPIRSLGAYSVPVRLHSDVTVSIKVDVVTEEELTRRKAAEAKAQAEAAAAAAAAAADAE